MNRDDIVVKEFVRDLLYGNDDQRIAAAHDLGLMGPRAITALNGLLKALDDKREEVRKFAAQAIGALGPGALACLPVLVERIRRKQEAEASLCCDLMGTIGRIACRATLSDNVRSAVLALVEALRSDPSETAREKAATALALIGPAAILALPMLFERIASRELCSAGLVEDPIDPNSQFIPIKLNDPTLEILERVIVAAGWIGPYTMAQIESLIALLADPEPGLRAAALRALGVVASRGDRRFREMARKAVIFHGMRETDSRVREALDRTFDGMGFLVAAKVA